MEPRVDLDQICSELPGLTLRLNLWRSLRNEATEGQATLTAGACVRASAQWLLTNGTPGAAPRVASVRQDPTSAAPGGRFSRRMNHSVVWIERSETQEACRLRSRRAGLSLRPITPQSMEPVPGK